MSHDLYQHLLDMLGAKDHADAGRIIGDHDDDERALCVPAAFIRRQAQRYLSNPKSERRG